MFRRKKKIDLSKYHIKINAKAMCMFEQLAHKSFLSIATEEDIITMLYCTLVGNEDFNTMTLAGFKILIEDEDLSRWLISEYTQTSKYLEQFAEEGETSQNKIFISDICSSLIIKNHMDAHYVYYEMDLWEILKYFEVSNKMYEEEMTNRRLFTYLQMLPMMDAKKIGGPEQLLPFPWEKDEKQKNIKKELEDMSDKITAAFAKQEERNGKG